jgi:Ulp1 family protease
VILTDGILSILSYPPSGVGAINITRADFKRLDDGEFFNDTLIEFGLK